MFHYVILYSLINLGRTTNSYLHQLAVLQNKFIRASLFLPQNSPTNSLYVKFQTLKLKDMIRLEFAKLIFNSKITCFHHHLAITLSISAKYTNTTLDKNHLAVIIIILSIASLGGKDYSTCAYRSGNLFLLLKRSALLLNLKITIKQFYLSISP